MSNTHTPADQKELEKVQRELDAVREASVLRSEKVVDLTSRFRELRRKNHFRLMLEEIFNE